MRWGAWAMAVVGCVLATPAHPDAIGPLPLAAPMSSEQGVAPSIVRDAVPSAWADPTGDHEVVMTEEITLPDHTVYRPADLANFGDGTRLPVVAFAGPGCDFNGTAFRPFYTEVASHGYLVVVSGPPEPRGGSGPGFPRTTPVDLSASISWALAENARPQSAYFQRLDPAAIAVMGQSCGGLQALSLAADPRITTLVMWNSGVLNSLPTPNPSPAGNGTPPIAPFTMPVGADKSVLETIKVPVAYFAGATDMAAANARDDFSRLKGKAVALGILDIPGDAHAGTFRQKNGGKFGQAGVAWLDWQLKGDSTAADMFVGKDCGLCLDPDWEFASHGLER